MSKLKILMCSEASFLSSGFGTYTKELLSRLHKTNKYIIAEFASYGFVNDPRDKDINWIYYANAVKDTDPRHAEYTSRGDNQFGRWRFDKVLLDFQPDIVIDIRDYWMSSYQAMSPLRSRFHWILMPTVDSEPQQEEWMDTFLSADAIFTYSDWGAEVLQKQSSNQVNYIDTASPGVDLDIFRIKDKNIIRPTFGIDKDAIVIGSVMRNQKRKLIPELLISFRKLIDTLSATQPHIASKLFLYLHTSYPDMGWDIPELLKDCRVANRVLFSYICKNCKHISCSTYSGPQKMCEKCLHKACSMPSVTEGFDTESLCDIYNMFDLYVQYSICEGFGMPQVEAAACGVPVITVNYSAMCDVIKKLNAYPVNIKTKFKEMETKAFRVYPDNDHLVDTIINFIQLPEPIKNKKRIEIRHLTEKYYNWDNICKKWEHYFDTLDANGFRGDWGAKPNMLTSFNIPTTMDKSKYFMTLVDECKQSLKDVSKIGSYQMLNLLKNADYGFTQLSPTQITAFGYQNIHEFIQTMVNNNNKAEQARLNGFKNNEDFLTYAKLKQETPNA